MDTVLFLVIQLLWLVPLGVAAWNRWVSAAIAAQRPVDIAEAALGQRVLLEGWAAPAHAAPRPSTLGLVTCLWHDWHIEQDSPSNGQSSGTLPSDNSGATEEPFALENAAGDRVLIDPTGAAFEAVETRSWTGPAVQVGGVSFGLGLGFGLLRYTERWILPKQPLFVLGRLDPPEPDDPSGIRGRMAGHLLAPVIVAGQSPEAVFAACRRKAEKSFLLAGALLPVSLAASWWWLG